MTIILNFLILYILTFLVSILAFSYGSVINREKAADDSLSKTSYNCIFGFIIIAVIALISNFFFPINQYLGNIFLILGLFLFLKYISNYKKIIFNLICISLIATIFISFDTINRPDAGLYHLPYIKTLQEDKIILGLSNLHFRFGHVSILQYISAIFNFSFIRNEIILLPLSVLIAAFFINIVSEFYNNENNKSFKFLIFIIFLFSTISYNRYSGYGNDGPTHLIVLLFLIQLFKIIEKRNFQNFNEISKLVLLAIFSYLNKPFMAVLIIFPMYYFIKYHLKNLKFFTKLFKNFYIILSMILFFAWTGKNILNSGCIAYPLETTCIKKLKYVDLQKTKDVKIMSEAWAKDWPNYKGDKVQSEYIKNLHWFETWKNNHFKIIYNKIIIFLISITVVFLSLIIYQKKIKKIYYQFSIDELFFLIFFISIFIFSFFKFPLYRFSSSFINIPFILLFYYLFKQFVNFDYTKKLQSFFVIILVSVIITKNAKKIFDNYKIRNVFPNIYTLSDNKEKNIKQKLKPIIQNNKIIYYTSKSECMYNKSLCTNIYNQKLYIKEIFGYKIFLLNNNDNKINNF